MTEAILDVRGISKSFGALKASDDVTLNLEEGEIHALIGPNGAGKSTLIKQVTGGLRPDAGQVRFCGEDVTELPTPKRARLGMGRTFQISSLAMENTVLQNTVLGVLGRKGNPFRFFAPVMKNVAMLEDAKAALAQVGLAEFHHHRTSEISHGQRRQLEVAVALTLRPKAFLMDEPMAGLGADGSRAMIRLLDQLRSQAPILLVEHDMDAVFSLADRISVLVYGKIIATGTPAEIRTNADVQAAYLGEETAV